MKSVEKNKRLRGLVIASILVYVLVGMFWDVILGITKIDVLSLDVIYARLQYCAAETFLGIFITPLFGMPPTPIMRITDIMFRALGALIVWSPIIWWIVKRVRKEGGEVS